MSTSRADDIDAPARLRRARAHWTHHHRPEGPLVAGIVDRFAAAGLACFGPSRAAARLEGSKAFTKDFLERHRIPTAGYAAFTADTYDPKYIEAQRLPLVVKADGLAAGKGVVICETHEAALAAALGMLGGSFGAAAGPSSSKNSCAAKNSASSSSQAIRKFCRSPLRRITSAATTAIGGRTPAAWAPTRPHPSSARIACTHHARSDRAHPARPSRRRQSLPGISLRGTDDRRGRHAECAGVQLPLRRSGNATHSHAPAKRPGRSTAKQRSPARWLAAQSGGIRAPRSGVVMAAGGYPDAYRKGDAISGLDAAARLPGKVFHAGTRAEGPGGERIVTAGGRVLCAVGLGGTVRRRAGPKPTIWCMPFIGTWCNIAATSAIAPSSEKAPPKTSGACCPETSPGERYDSRPSEYRRQAPSISQAA